MTLPDVDVQIADAPAQRFAPLSPANWFVAGFAQRGPVGTPLLVRSLAEFKSYYGVREASDPYLYDSLDVFFREGGKHAYVSRLAGPDPVTAGGELDDSGDATITVAATSPGAWGNDIDVEVSAGSGGFEISVLYDDVLVESSPFLESVEEAVLWAATTAYVRFTAIEDGGLPVDQSIALTAGDDDRGDVTATEVEAALEVFTRDLGGGQLSVPGDTTEETAELVLEYAAARKRVAKLDAANSDDDTAVEAAALALRTTTGHEFGAPFWPWETCPGVSPGTERTVPPCARNAAILARVIAGGGSVGDPAAGEKYPAQYVTGLASAALSDARREALNDAGVNVSRVIRGSVYTYGNRTLANPLTEGNWAQLNQSSVIQAIAARSDEIGGRYVHAKVDGKGIKVGEFAGELDGMLMSEFYGKGDLYGDSPADAFTVIPGVDIADATATLLATIQARVSPGADRVEIQIYKQPIAG